MMDRTVDRIARAFDFIRAPIPVRAWNARRAGRAFDRRFGTDTQGRVEVAELGVGPDIARHAVHYEPSTLPKVRRALRNLRVRHEQFEFVDFGSGKGVVTMLASRYPFRRVIGVEASGELHRAAERNLQLYRRVARMRAPVDLVNQNALAYDFGETSQAVYLYNPFGPAVLRPLVTQLLALPKAQALVIAYVNPVYRDVFDETGEFAARFDDGSLLVLERR